VPTCASKPFAGDCCNNPGAVSAGQCGCVGSVCTFKISSTSPLVWQNNVIGSDLCRC
jgi:hypothetical protein